MDHPDEGASQVNYRIDTPRISSETIDGETIIIDFESGVYFSTDGIGAAIWEEIRAGRPGEEIVAETCLRYPQAEPECRRTVEAFLALLHEEGLVVALAEELPTPPSGTVGSRAYPDRFVIPALTKYTDMQELLLLDPIHDVDEQGWPLRKPAQGQE